MDIQYIGEQLLWGKIGNLLVFTAFTAALLAAISYFFAIRTEDRSWRKLARQAFAIHTISITGIFGLLFYLILNHRFEYVYVWEHSNTIMPLKYILSCFWEGQEGSFLLWMFWHCVLGWVLILTAGEWESGVMFVISMVQVFLASMILGVVVLGYKLGNNPFVLLREHPDFANLPFIKMPDYLSRIKDGRGLNPLLQNYWMTIHPPTLFLGFAATVVPFAFAIAGLLRKKYSEWIKPALPWTFFGVMILGTGILMGAAWAYESLSFGGFWAWDPVENASLVPWMTLVGLAHVMLIYKHRQRSLMSNYLLAIATFFFILYSTFLTRSGILGNSSVHAFTDLGMSGHLLIYMLFFLVLSAFLLIKNYKALKESHEEEHLSSREFWMFIGMLVLVIGCLQITFTTSLPVFNKLFGLNMAAPTDAIDHYNKWQVPVAIFICLLIGIAQFFKYKKSEWKDIRKKLTFSLMISILITALSAFYLGTYRVHYYILFFASVFAVVANLAYIISVLKGKLGNSGASIAHIGIGLILLGALVSNSKKEVISRNLKNVDLGKDMPNKENIMIEQKIDTLPMGNYYVTYSKRETEGVNVFFTIEYFKPDPLTGEKVKQFELKPFVQLNERMGNVAEPATKHFFDKDIYTHITYAEIEKATSDHGEEGHNHEENEDYQPYKKQMLAVGDTFITSNSFVILRSLKKDLDRKDFELRDSDLIVGADLMVQDINKTIYESMPVFVIKDFSVYTKTSVVDELGLKFEFSKIDPTTGKIELSIAEKKENKADFIVMKAIIFPYINVLWIGCLLMIIGSVIAIRKMIIKNRKTGKV
ncbi:MAG: heme lyase CcmF/NrfE family subunit [Bacteroidota bacterium]